MKEDMAVESTFILYVTRKHIWLGDYSGPKPKIAHLEWDGTNAVAAFTAIKRAVTTPSLRIVLGNDLSYVVCFEIEQAAPDRASVFEAAKEEIPEDISDASFDWKIVGKHKTEGFPIIQATAISAKILALLSMAGKETGIAIESMTPVPIVLAQMTRYLPPSHMILWSQYESLAVVASQGIVYGVRDISTETVPKITELSSYIMTKFGFRIAHYYMDWSEVFEKSVDMTAFSKQVLVNADASRYTMDPMKFVATEEPESGQDEDILSIQSSQQPFVEPARAEKTVAAPSGTQNAAVDFSDVEIRKVDKKTFGQRLKKFLREFKALIGLGLVLILAIGMYIYRSERRTAQPVADNATSVTSPASAPAVAGASTSDVSAYTVSVLNGSGIEGAASNVKTLLLPMGFSAITTGNADSYSVQETRIRMKPSVPASVYTDIVGKLAGFETIRSDDLSPQSVIDIVITVGSKRNK